MKDCIFCRIANGQLPAEVVYEDDAVMAFKDIKPAAPVHILIISKKHISTLADAREEDKELLGHILLVVNKLAEQFGLEKGFRLINNCGADGGQVVFHLHFHLLGGRKLNPSLGV